MPARSRDRDRIAKFGPKRLFQPRMDGKSRREAIRFARCYGPIPYAWVGSPQKRLVGRLNNGVLVLGDKAERGGYVDLLRHQTTLARFGELALRSNDLDEILTEACRLAGEALGTDLAKVVELQEDGKTL